MGWEKNAPRTHTVDNLSNIHNNNSKKLDHNFQIPPSNKYPIDLCNRCDVLVLPASQIRLYAWIIIDNDISDLETVIVISQKSIFLFC